MAKGLSRTKEESYPLFLQTLVIREKVDLGVLEYLFIS